MDKQPPELSSRLNERPLSRAHLSRVGSVYQLTQLTVHQDAGQCGAGCG